MKIALINPPNIHHLKSVLPEPVEEERGYNPPLGLLYLAGYIQKHSPEHQIKVIDPLPENLNHQQVKEKMENFSPDILGVNVMSFTLIDALKVAKKAKENNPKIKIVFGGPHVHIYPQKTLEQKNIDYVVLGEGEKTFYKLINNIENEEYLKQTPGLAFFDKNNNYINTGSSEFIQNLDEIPLPARNLIDNNKYYSILGTSKLVTTMITSRGCPYNCLFCDRPHLGKVFRARTAKNVIKEIEDCLKYGIREFLFYDDTFTIDRKRVIDICNLIIEKKLDISWDIRARVNTVDEEMLKKLKQAGCLRVHYGVESGTQKILNILRKGITLEQIEKAFKITKKSGMETLAYFMIGNPEETKEDIEKTIKFAKKINPDYVHITGTMPFPATDLYKKALEENVIKKDVWHEFAKNPDPNFAPPLWTKNLSQEEIGKYVKKAYHRFYFRPTYILKRILKLKSFEEFKTKAKAGLKMLKI